MTKKMLVPAMMIATMMMGASVTSAQNLTTQQAASYPTTQPYENYIQVTGRAELDVVPDEIYVRIIINESDNKGKVTVEKQEREMVAALKALGINTEKVLMVEDMSSNFKEYWLKRNQARTTKSYQLKLPDAVTVAKAVGAMEAIGISNTDVVRVAHSQIVELQAKVRIQAMVNAKEQAQTLASAVGQKAGRAVFIADYNGDVVMPRTLMVNARAEMDTVVGYTKSMPALDFKTIKISYSIQAKFALE